MHGKNHRHLIPVGRVGPKWKQAGFDNSLGYRSCELGIRDTIAELQEWYGIQVRMEIKPRGQGSWAWSWEKRVSFGMNGLAYYAKNGYPEYPTLQYLLGLQHRRGERPKKVHGYFADPYRAGRIVAGHEYAHILTDVTLGGQWWHQVPYQLVYARVLDCLFPGFGAVGRVYHRHGEKISLRYPQVQKQIVSKLDQEAP
jgi:hypothetical protein